MLFYTEHRDAVKSRISSGTKAQPGSGLVCKPQDISREICRLWQRLSPQQTKEYCLLSNLYAESLAKHGAGGAGGGSRGKGVPGGSGHSSKPARKAVNRLPKPPQSAFMWFSRHNRAAVRSENRELSFGEIGKAVGVLWKAANAAARRPFEDLAAEVSVCVWLCVRADSPTCCRKPLAGEHRQAFGSCLSLSGVTKGPWDAGSSAAQTSTRSSSHVARQRRCSSGRGVTASLSPERALCRETVYGKKSPPRNRRMLILDEGTKSRTRHTAPTAVHRAPTGPFLVAATESP